MYQKFLFRTSRYHDFVKFSCFTVHVAKGRAIPFCKKSNMKELKITWPPKSFSEYRYVTLFGELVWNLIWDWETCDFCVTREELSVNVINLGRVIHHRVTVIWHVLQLHNKPYSFKSGFTFLKHYRNKILCWALQHNISNFAFFK